MNTLQCVGFKLREKIFSWQHSAIKTNTVAEMDFTYFNAVYTVENTLSKVKDEKWMKRVEKFMKQGVCPHCNGTRLSERGYKAGAFSYNTGDLRCPTCYWI